MGIPVIEVKGKGGRFLLLLGFVLTSLKGNGVRRLERELDAVLALQPSHRHGRRLRKRYLAVRESLFAFLAHPQAPPDNNRSERDLRSMVTYRKVTGGSRSAWGPDLCAGIKSVVGTAARRGIDAYHAILAVLAGRTLLAPG